MEILLHHFPLGLCLSFLVSVSLSMPTTNVTTDQYALLALKAHISSDPQQILAKNWTSESLVCDWIGVTCGALHRRVTAINVSNMNLTSTIPPQLGNLSFLVSLNMSRNKFYGEIPPELARLRRLRVLDLRLNDLTGEIPQWLGSLDELQFLSLVTNSFTGLIPASISNVSKLATLWLGYNSLQGNIPTEIFNVSSLESIFLMGNGLSGNIPDDMCHNLPRLSYISLQLNSFSGQIPSSLGECSELLTLSFSSNQFTGSIPKGIWNLKKLEVMYFANNHLIGQIPKEISNLTTLKFLDLNTNNITGVIPEEMSNLYNLRRLDLALNNLTGSIPLGIFNLSFLTLMSFGGNKLSGNLPSTMGHGLPNLESLYLYTNSFTGPIPNSMSNSSKLKILEIGQNNFTGAIPNSMGNLRFLEEIALTDNNLVNDPSSQELSLISVLANSKNLTKLSVADNPLNAILPDSIGNLSSSVEYLYAYRCGLSGNIPAGIGNLTSLVILSLYSNQLTGSLPSTVKDLQNLQAIVFRFNKLSNAPLDNFCALKQFGFLDMSQNQISGSIPGCLGNVTTLRTLRLASNMFNSTLPEDIWNLKDLLELNLSSNSLRGSLSLQVKNLREARSVSLSGNHFSGGIPITFGDMETLNYLSLANNELQGLIPDSIGGMLSLKTLDLSHNFLSGSIPMSLETLKDLTLFNVSFNNLSGEIPSGGPFGNFTSESFISNHALCGAYRFNVPPCPRNSTHSSRPKLMNRLKFVLASIIVVVALIVVMFFAFVYLRYQKRNRKGVNNAELSLSVAPERISYYKLLQATNAYDDSNLLGNGSFGSVYRGILDDGRVVAIKVLNLQLEGALKSFDSECEALCNLRHRNIAKVISCCSNPDFKALVLEFMPNASLDKWLYSHNYCLDIMQRLDILIDVASALEYLHHGCSSPVVHCDLKPSNVLLDQDMVAHVSDFGIVKLLSKDQDSFTYTKTLATLCYLAPEYGLEGLVSTKCDVYSFGIMLMEVFTRMNPNNEMFGENLSIRSWVNDHMPPNALAYIVDSNMLRPHDEYFIEKMDCIISLMKVALNCTRESPRDRNNIKDALSTLKKIKSQLLRYDTEN